MFFSASPDPQSLLELNCLVLGDQRNHIFPVKIAETESVGSLKKAIKEEKRPLFNHIAADALELWNVSEPIDQHLENNLEKANFHEKESLSPVDKLSKIFPNLPVEGCLHIVVWCPEDGKLRDSFCSDPVSLISENPEHGEQRDAVSSLQDRRMNLCEKRYQAPSSEGHFDTFRKEQAKEGRKIHCGRPIRLDRGVPASLFDETLSQFQYDLAHCVPTPADIRCFARLRRQLTEIFEKEIDRQTKLIEILREENIIPRGGNLNPNTIGKYTTDGDVRTTTPCCYGDFLYFVQEIKNEFSTGKAEPYMEAIHYWWAHIRQHIERTTSQVRDRLNFPAILLVHAGVLQFSLLLFNLTL